MVCNMIKRVKDMALTSIYNNSTPQVNPYRALSESFTRTVPDSREKEDTGYADSDKVTIGSVSGKNEEETYSPFAMKNSLPASPFEEENPNTEETGENDGSGKTEDPSKSKEDSTSSKTGGTDYTEEELKEIEKLKNRDKEVRSHEQAHIAAGGQYVRGSAQFEYQTGPDGGKYAIGGEVSIDVSKVSGNPEATIAKMQAVIRSALAPANPSSQDRSVASKASQMESEARMEAFKNNSGNLTGSPEKSSEQDATVKPGDATHEKQQKIDRYA
jgi:hypothetical protein